jgi:hypothetical protein
VFRDQTAGRPLAGHPALRSDCDRCLRPPRIWNGGVNRHGHPSPHCESSKSAHHDPGFCVPSQGDNMATARGGTLVPAPATAPDCLLVLREPETCKQVRDIGDSRDWAASSPRGGRCSTPEAVTLVWRLLRRTNRHATGRRCATALGRQQQRGHACADRCFDEPSCRRFACSRPGGARLSKHYALAGGAASPRGAVPRPTRRSSRGASTCGPPRGSAVWRTRRERWFSSGASTCGDVMG